MGIDYNRSPTIYFRIVSNTTKSAEPNTATKTPETTFKVENHEILLLQQILLKIEDLKKEVFTKKCASAVTFKVGFGPHAGSDKKGQESLSILLLNPSPFQGQYL